MDKKIASSRRLQLNRETLRSLTRDELAGVAGGTGYVVVSPTNFICVEPPPGIVVTVKSHIGLCMDLPGGPGPAGNPGGG